MTTTPWAILLCKFNDDTSAAIYPRSRFDELFTSAGNGKFNMVDYFRDMSHGRLDLNGSKVFPPPGGRTEWYTITHPATDYLGWNTPVHGRGALLVWAREAAAAHGDDLTGFSNIVVVMNTATDLYGSLDGVATDDGRNPDNGMSSLSPSILGQEMGHGYGLDHARIEGSTADYMDPFDIMSTVGSFMAPHPFFTERDMRGNSVFLIGPGLNAATMNHFGWLDQSRVWTSSSGNKTSTVKLRPLHRTDLPGYLCLRINDLFIEFRMNDLWDGAFSEPMVLIHDYFDGHSYLRLADDGFDHFTAGDTMSEGDVSNQPGPLHGAGLKITVTDIDSATQTATIQLQRWADTRPEAGPGMIFGGVDVGGDGFIVINGKVKRIPPHSPLHAILEQISEVEQSQVLANGLARGLIQKQAYSAIAATATEHATRALSVRQPTQAVLRNVAQRNRRSPG
jgi:hypothetical protein